MQSFLIDLMSETKELLYSIFDGKTPALYFEFENWVKDSRRFRAFATEYQSKIRAKLRNARDESGVKDVRAELETAALLLRAEQFTLEYETYAASKQRGPDFTVTFKTHTRFNVEVRRIRNIELEQTDPEARITKLLTVLCDKVGQMPPSFINLLWLTAEREISETDLARAVMTLLQLAERKDRDFFARRGFTRIADFFKQYRRLSGIVLHQNDKILLWLNPLAQHTLPLEIAKIIPRLGTL